jgi:hypothetical protein
MIKNYLEAPEGAKYLNEFMTELPVNCLFDKGKTGCGGTTIAIENDKDTIIAMPYVNTIKNKESQHANLLGIYEGVTDTDILDYLETHQLKKIAITYDRLEYLIELMQHNGYNPYKDFYLLVDEWHILFNSYAFRKTAVKRVLLHSRKFEKVTYMTATPIEDEFILEELKDLPVKEMRWSNVAIVNIKPIQTTQPLRKVCDLIQETLKTKAFYNLHFFVNSVEFIAQIIRRCELPPDQVRIICSNNKHVGKGKKSNQKKLGDEYLIASTTDEIKKINFYTSTCFEGADIYDLEGKTYIVSDKFKSHTLLDISTLVIQICGRIRDSRYQTDICHIFSTTRYNGDVTLEEFKAASYKQVNETKSWVNSINDMDATNRNTTIKLLLKGTKSGLNDIYIKEENGKFCFDENLVKLDIVNFKITHSLYQSRVTLSDEYRKFGFSVSETEYVQHSTDKLKANPNARVSFKDLFIEYANLKKDVLQFYIGRPNPRIDLIEQEKLLVKEAYEVLGVERVKAMNYNVSNIKREIINKRVDISLDRKIILCLQDHGVSEGVRKTAKEWKQLLQGIYENLDIRSSSKTIKTAKATNLNEWFEVKKTTPKIDGKTTDCYTIVKIKTLFVE